jgi:hypothetical protein
MEKPDLDRFCKLSTIENEVDKLSNMNLNELLGVKKHINDVNTKYKQHIKTGNPKYTFRTDEQEEIRHQWIKYLNKYYPVEDCTTAEADKNRPIRRKYGDYLNIRFNKNNDLILGDNKKTWIDAIDKLLGDKHTYNHKEYMNEEITCVCGCKSIRKHLSRHKQSKKHLIFESMNDKK